MLFNKQIQLGVILNDRPSGHHGHVAYATPDGQTMRYPIYVDRPELLIRHHHEVIENLFKQMSDLGSAPIQLEIHTASVRRIYAYGRLDPVLVEHTS